MVRARWRNRIGPPSLLLGLALLLTAALSASAVFAARLPGPGSAGQCSTTPVKAARAALRQGSETRAAGRTQQRLGRRGELIGRTLLIDRPSLDTVQIQLPAESFVGHRQGNAVVYTRSGGGRGSEVHLVDLATGCDTVIARPSVIARSAILSPDASAVYVHGVTPRSRADAGVVRYDLPTGNATEVVPALTSRSRLGRIFGTQMAWSLGSESLTVQSCGFAECLSRVLDVASGALRTVESAGQGALVGTTDSALVTYATCPGLPCAVIAHDISTGTRRVLSHEAFETGMRILPDGRASVSITTAEGLVEVVP
jgi:hypothetical protein